MYDGEVLGVIPKTERAEVRVIRKLHKGRAVVDLRVWWLPDGAADYVPSRKGVTVDESKAAELVAALELVPCRARR